MKNYLFIFILFTLSSCGQNEIPKDFKQTSLPKNDSEAKRELNYSSEDFSVEIIGNKLKVNKAKHNQNSELKITNGILKGVNQGEWGGKIEFVPNDKNEKVILIKKGNIKFIFMFENNIYFIEGLAHGSFNEGELYQLKYLENKFTYKSLLKFEDSPEAMTIFENKIYIAGYANFYVIDKFKKEEVFKNTFWSSLYPNSIAIIDENKMYLGIRGGIIKLNLPKKEILFYKYIKN